MAAAVVVALLATTIETKGHQPRHTCASLAIKADANIKVVQRLLGHKTAGLTLDRYGHLYDENLDAIADAFDVVVGTPAYGLRTIPAAGPVRPARNASEQRVSGALGEIRTHTVRVLNPFPLPVGIRGQSATAV